MSPNFRTSQVKLVKKSTNKSGKKCVVTQQHGTCCSKARVGMKNPPKSWWYQFETNYSSFCFGFQTPQILIYNSETCIPDASFWNHPTYGMRICSTWLLYVWYTWGLYLKEPFRLECCPGIKLYSWPSLLRSFKAGNKKALAASAVYPIAFGMAVAALIPARSNRPSEDAIDLTCFKGEDSLGSVDDLIKGVRRCWWRRLRWMGWCYLAPLDLRVVESIKCDKKTCCGDSGHHWLLIVASQQHWRQNKHCVMFFQCLDLRICEIYKVLVYMNALKQIWICESHFVLNEAFPF